MKREGIKICRLMAIVLMISILPDYTSGQCDRPGCVDCFSHCPVLQENCETDFLIKSFCKKTCKNCPSESSACRLLGCDHNCVIPPHYDTTSSPRCTCFPGYQLAEDGKTCNDIDECQNRSICAYDSMTPACVNLPGSFTCSGCSAWTGVWQYYNRSGCCKRRAKNFRHCGFSSTNGRIVKGRFAAVARWPWTAYITIGERLCGGSLLTRRWVLTSAHCINSVQSLSEITVVMGVLNTTQTGNVHEQTFRVVQKMIHPQFSFPNHDIALLRLHKNARLSRYVGTVCLPQGHEPQINDTCFASGYGSIEHRGPVAAALQEVDLPIVRSSLCAEAYANTSNRINPNIHLCAGYESGGKDACQGDSGGPLVCQRCNNCDWYLAGITSFGVGCGRPGYYGVYTRVRTYENWIASITGQEVEQRGCVRPSWHEWGPWTTCSNNCGGGTRTRSRFCMNGRQGEPDCIGSSDQTEDCNTAACQTASWSSWTSGSCSSPCGGGLVDLTRTCIGGEIDDDGCDDDEGHQTVRPCNTQNCPAWEDWGTWGPCSTTCGDGVRHSNRTCNNYGSTDATCVGNSSRIETCSNRRCPTWSEYGDWSECDSSCEEGSRFRTRTCLYTTGQAECDGSPLDIGPCNTQNCPAWEDWGAWGPCSTTCGDGVRHSNRTCNNYGSTEATCVGNSSRIETCSNRRCPTWSEYGDWSECDSSCEEGSRFRTRTCLYTTDQAECDGSPLDIGACNSDHCPRWGDYGNWTSCSTSCGGGSQMRTRSCLRGTVGQPGCVGEVEETRGCNENIQCPLWTDYEEWSSCSRSCGGGTQMRSRICLHGIPGQPSCIGDVEESRECNGDIQCPGWSDYGNWTICSKSCGRGTQMRTRSCLHGTVGQPGCIGDIEETRGCNENIQCPLWTDYEEWSSCSRSCGGGTQMRSRICLHGIPGQAGCNGNMEETRGCNDDIQCPRWSDYVEWTSCSRSCGGGTQMRTRNCLHGTVGQDGCVGDVEQTKDCNVDPCPYWSEYGEWGACSLSCGGGVRGRTRECINGIPGQEGCEGSLIETGICPNSNCPEWSEYTNSGNCSVSCGGGTQLRVRQCLYGVVGQSGCIGPTNVTTSCNTESCPGQWGEFGSYGKCTSTCGGGTRSRMRPCIGGTVGLPDCIGSETEEVECNTNPCETGPCAYRINKELNERCEWFARIPGYCVIYSDYMLKNCDKSCCEHGNNVFF